MVTASCLVWCRGGAGLKLGSDVKGRGLRGRFPAKFALSMDAGHRLNELHHDARSEVVVDAEEAPLRAVAPEVKLD